MHKASDNISWVINYEYFCCVWRDTTPRLAHSEQASRPWKSMEMRFQKSVRVHEAQSTQHQLNSNTTSAHHQHNINTTSTQHQHNSNTTSKTMGQRKNGSGECSKQDISHLSYVTPCDLGFLCSKHKCNEDHCGSFDSIVIMYSTLLRIYHCKSSCFGALKWCVICCNKLLSA